MAVNDSSKYDKSIVDENRCPFANNELSEVFDIIKPGRRVKIKGYRQ